MKQSRMLILILFGVILNASFALAQSGKMPWVDGDFPPVNGPYDYMVARGEGVSLRFAREDAFNSFLIDLGNAAGVSVSSRTLSEIKREFKYSGGAMDYDESETSSTTYHIEREGFKASFIKVSECYETVRTANGLVYLLWELYEVSSRRRFEPYIPAYTDRYGGDALWRSMLLPGWGQLYKGAKTKGLFVIGGEIALVGGIVATENLRASYMKKIGETHNDVHIRTYARKADTMENARNLCIAGATALYLYNLVDALAAPGKKHLMRDRWVSIFPVATETYTGVGLVMNF
jgi:hypothetical protein